MTVLPQPLVDADWLAAAIDRGDELVIADVRWRLADGPLRTEYEHGHIPGAVFADLDADLSASPSAADGRHPLPTPEAFAVTRRRLGMGDGVPVVVYDDAGGAIADGTSATSLLDARSTERYRGDVVAVDPRPGHIPGAHSMPTAGNLGPDGRFLLPDALADRYRDHAEDGDVVVSCGSGVTACHDALAMAAAGLALPRLYPGSFSQWSADEDRPVVTGPAATPTS